MDIIKRNFFNLLCNGAFGDNLPTEPMSQYKWNLLQTAAEEHQVAKIIASAKDGNSIIEYPSIPDAGLSRMSNTILNNRLVTIRENEPTADDSSIETLNMLDIIVQATEALLSRGVIFGHIVRIGQYLRSDGDKIDYVKLDIWLRRLGIYRMSQLEASILVALLGFEQDEIQFLTKMDDRGYTKAITALNASIHRNPRGDDTQHEYAIFDNSGKSATWKSMCNACKYIPMAPIEAISFCTAKLIDKLSVPEE